MSITRDDARLYRREMEEALAEFCAKHNLDLKIGTIHMLTSSVSVKLELVQKAEGPGGINVNLPEAQAYLKIGHRYDLLPGKLGVIFTTNDGTEYIFQGIAPRRTQYPFSATRRRDGKAFKFGRSIVRAINEGTEVAP